MKIILQVLLQTFILLCAIAFVEIIGVLCAIGIHSYFRPENEMDPLLGKFLILFSLMASLPVAWMLRMGRR